MGLRYAARTNNAVRSYNDIKISYRLSAYFSVVQLSIICWWRATNASLVFLSGEGRSVVNSFYVSKMLCSRFFAMKMTLYIQFVSTKYPTLFNAKYSHLPACQYQRCSTKRRENSTNESSSRRGS